MWLTAAIKSNFILAANLMKEKELNKPKNELQYDIFTSILVYLLALDCDSDGLGWEWHLLLRGQYLPPLLCRMEVPQVLSFTRRRELLYLFKTVLTISKYWWLNHFVTYQSNRSPLPNHVKANLATSGEEQPLLNKWNCMGRAEINPEFTSSKTGFLEEYVAEAQSM